MRPAEPADGCAVVMDKRVSLGVLALLCLVAAPLPADGAAPESAPECRTPVSARHPIERVAGSDRYATAACASAAAFPDGAAHVLVARGDAAGGYADALAGAVLASAVEGPLLLTEPGRLPQAVADEIARLRPATVTVLGGPAAVAVAVEDDIAALGPDTERVAGPDRYATAAAVSRSAGATGTAFLVNGFRPPDSLVAAAVAARRGAALLLTAPDGVPAVTAAALGSTDRVVIVGGYGVVGQAVEDDVTALVGAGRVRRVSGGSRAETAASMARAFPAGGLRTFVAGTDASLADAVTAGWAAARPDGGPVLYVERDRPGQSTDRWLRLGGLAGGEASRLLGGRLVLSDALVGALEVRYDEARAGGPAAELRGVWAHLFDKALKSPAGIDALLDAAAAANLNTVVVEVARRQDAYYDSAVLPRTADPDMPDDLDLLRRLVPAAHDRGLQVHAWVPALPAYHGTYDGLDLGASHVWSRHGPSTPEPWTTRSAAGADSVYLDPGVPAVQDHVAAIYAELAIGTDVDAVHVDYLRYDGPEWGYHPASLERFRGVTGATGVPAPDDPAWSAWRRRQTEDLARRILLDVAEADPSTAVSMAASTQGQGPGPDLPYPETSPYRSVFQDWPSWLRQGLVDAAFPMNYFREATHADYFDRWVAFERSLPDAGVTAVGLGAYLNSLGDSLSQASTADGGSLDGLMVYSYQQNVASGPPGALMADLASTLFDDPAPAPVLRAAAATGHVRAQVADGVVVEAAAAAGPARTVTADATGRAGFVGLTPGTWIFSAPGYAPAAAVVVAGEVTTVALAPIGPSERRTEP